MDRVQTLEPVASPREAFRAAVAQYGSQTAYAQRFAVTQQAVSLRLAEGKSVWAEHVLTVERETGVSRHALRPDLYPVDEAAAARRLIGVSAAQGERSCDRQPGSQTERAA